MVRRKGKELCSLFYENVFIYVFILTKVKKYKIHYDRVDCVV